MNMLQESNSYMLRVRFISQLGRFIYDSISSFLIVVGLLYILNEIGIKYCWDCLVKFVMKYLI